MNSTNSSSPIQSAFDRQGWTQSPNGRGTMSIIWSCALTMFLCCWAVLINNLPEPGSSRSTLLARKLILLVLCAAAPEIILQVSLGQWLSARKSVKLFHESGHDHWTLRHGFFVDMGGLHLQTPDHGSFPINSQQLHYLMKKGYVDVPRIQEEQIRDKDKVDGMLRFITLVQTMAFIVNLILRALQHLDITALELSTAAFVFSSSLTTLFWIKKPADVQGCEFLSTGTPVASIRLDAGIAPDAVYSCTPLDFIGREEWAWSILWMHGLNCLRRLHLAGQPQQLPFQRFNNTTVPVIKGWFLFLFAVITMAFFAIVVAGWNFSFPTRTERILWHIASLTAMISAFGALVVQQLFFNWMPALQRRQEWDRLVNRSSKTKEQPQKQDSWRTRVENMISLISNNSISRDPALNAPVGAIISTYVLGFFYLSSRGYIILADLIELRSLPSSAYKSLDWASLAPYVP